MKVRARVTRVVDGDTVMLLVRCRLATIQSPEMGTPEGNAARQVTSDRLGKKRVVVDQQYGADAFGRWLVILSPEP